MERIRTAEDLHRTRFKLRKDQLSEEEDRRWRVAQYRYWREVIGPLLSRIAGGDSTARIAGRTLLATYKEKKPRWPRHPYKHQRPDGKGKTWIR